MVEEEVGPLDQLDKEPKSEVAEKPVTKKWVARPFTTVSNCFIIFLLDIVVETHACNMIDRKRKFCTYDKFALFSYSIQQEFPNFSKFSKILNFPKIFIGSGYLT